MIIITLPDGMVESKMRPGPNRVQRPRTRTPSTYNSRPQMSNEEPSFTYNSLVWKTSASLSKRKSSTSTSLAWVGLSGAPTSRRPTAWFLTIASGADPRSWLCASINCGLRMSADPTTASVEFSSVKLFVCHWLRLSQLPSRAMRVAISPLKHPPGPIPIEPSVFKVEPSASMRFHQTGSVLWVPSTVNSQTCISPPAPNGQVVAV